MALVGNAGSYALRSTYTILTADQGLSGTFEGVASRYAFLDPTLSYDANNAYLNLTRNDVSLVDAARTRNQAAVARAISVSGSMRSIPSMTQWSSCRPPSPRAAPSTSCPARSWPAPGPR